MTRFEHYRNIDAVNYSTLKAILSESFNQIRRESDAMNLGSLVDCMITTPEEFDEQFAVITSKPGDKPKQIVDHIFETEQAIVGFGALDKEYLFSLMDMFEYRTTYKDLRDERRFEFFKNDVFNYYTERLANKSSIIVDESDVELADRIATSIKNGRFTAPFHNLPFGIKAHNQVIITWNYKGIACKGLLDRVLENTTDTDIKLGAYTLPAKSIVVIDYKTMQGKVSRFNKQMWKYRLDIQSSFYSYGIIDWLTRKKPDIRFHEFLFIVESTTSIGTPIVYKLSETDKQVGRWGGNKMSDRWTPASHWFEDFDSLANYYNLDVLGWEQALSLYKWHHENNEWEYSMDAVLSNGIVETTQYL